MMSLLGLVFVELTLRILGYRTPEIPSNLSFELLFEANGIDYIDCNVKLTHLNTIPGDGHPIESVHEEWDRRISNDFAKTGLQ